ncbi:MAG: hypothetical protein HYZ58_09035 [Acidobacteria bacterium]|nr:hypothetical protein [Acidobacteriota bacterium]
MVADTAAPVCFTMKRHADSPFELLALTTQMPSIEGAPPAVRSFDATARVARNG